MIRTTRRMTLALLSACAVALAASAAAQPKEPLKIGFVYVSPIGDAGWTFQHDTGRKEMEKALGGKVTTKYIESVPEGADAVLDVVAGAALCWLCGFHVAFLPTFIGEALPTVDLFPTWTLAVLYVTRQGGKKDAPGVNAGTDAETPQLRGPSKRPIDSGSDAGGS